MKKQMPKDKYCKNPHCDNLILSHKSRRDYCKPCQYMKAYAHRRLYSRYQWKYTKLLNSLKIAKPKQKVKSFVEIDKVSSLR